MSLRISFRLFQATAIAAVLPLVLLAAGCFNGFGTDLPQDKFIPPKPGILSLSPSSAVAGGPRFTLTVNGTNFTNLSQVNWNGGGRNTTFVSATQLTAVIDALDIASAGTEQVTVVNAASLSNNVAVSDPANFVVTSSAGPPIGVQGVISVNTAGDFSNAVPNTLIVLSATGRYAAFQNEHATNLVGAPTPSQGIDTYFHDSCTGAEQGSGCSPVTKLISVINGAPDDGGNDGNGPSVLHGAFSDVSISGDGRFVVFISHATNLVSPAAQFSQAYIRDTCAGTGPGCMPSTKMVSLADNATEPNSPAAHAEISAGGRFVAFSGGNLLSSVTFGGVYLRDTNPGCPPGSCTILVSVDNNGNPTNDTAGSSYIAVSASGRFVVFDSPATNLPGAPSGHVPELYVRDTCINAPGSCQPSTTIVSVDNNNVPAQSIVTNPSISDDGRIIAFVSNAQLAPNSLNSSNVYLRDTCRNEAVVGLMPGCPPATVTASVALDGTAANQGSLLNPNPHTVSGTGRYVVFESSATNLVQSATPAGGVFVRETCLGVPNGCTPHNVLVSQDAAGGFIPGNFSAISSDGHFCAFMPLGSSSVADAEQAVLCRTGF